VAIRLRERTQSRERVLDVARDVREHCPARLVKHLRVGPRVKRRSVRRDLLLELRLNARRVARLHVYVVQEVAYFLDPRVDCEKFPRAVDLDGHVHPVHDDEEVRADLIGALHGLHVVPAAQEIVGDEDLRREADELLPVASREKAPERAAGSVDSFEVQHGVGEVLIVGVGDPTVDLSLCLSEDAGKRVGRLALERRVRQQRGHRR
jgi:hypothetical protein